MVISKGDSNERVLDVRFHAHSLMDGRTFGAAGMVSLAVERHTRPTLSLGKSGGGYGIHWPDMDEDLSTKGLLRGAPAVKAA